MKVAVKPVATATFFTMYLKIMTVSAMRVSVP